MGVLIEVVCVITMSTVSVSGVIFTYEPVNATVDIGERVTFNCSATQEDLVAFWIINKYVYDWTDLISSTIYNFDLRDNSLTINNSTKTLDGTSFQCVLNGHASRIAYLTVESPSDQHNGITSSPWPPHPTREPTDYSRPVSTYTTALDQALLQLATEEMTALNSTTANDDLATVLIGAVSGGIVTVTIILVVLVVCIIKCHTKCTKLKERKKEHFVMVSNDIYGINKFKTTPNESYSCREGYFSG